MEDSQRTFGFQEGLALFYSGEVGGEAFFSERGHRESDPETALKLANLLQLETETKTLLRVPMVAAGLSIREDPEVRAAAAARGADPGASWGDLVERMKGQIEGRFMALFQRYAEAARERGVAEEIRICDHMIDHEICLLDFVRREQAGEGLDRVLEPLRARLRLPV